jgi:putative membrane protein
MAVIRPSISLIGFGFDVQFFQRLRDQNMISGGGGSARRFGVTLDGQSKGSSDAY